MNISIELKLNTLRDLKEVLLDFSSIEEQQQYKNSVPYVHIPIEILEQLSDQARMLKNCSWYSELFTKEEAKKIIDFYKYTYEETEVFDEDFPDVPEIFEEETWKLIIIKAKSLYEEFKEKIEAKTKNLHNK